MPCLPHKLLPALLLLSPVFAQGALAQTAPDSTTARRARLRADIMRQIQEAERQRPGSTDATASAALYTQVTQPPALPTGGGRSALVRAIAQQIVITREADFQAGVLYVNFFVDKDGHIANPSVVNALSPAQNQAVLTAVGKLPRLVPARQNNRPVNYSLTLPIRFE